MVDLAKQAFNTKNFDLAAEIYERTITENGPKLDLFLGLADSFARGGKFNKALEVYSAAYRLGRIGEGHLKHLVTSLIDAVQQDRPNSNPNKPACMFSCLLCKGLLNDPVTLPCGHTYCRKCLEKDPNKRCNRCNTVHYKIKISNIKSNVLVSKLIEKWFCNENKAAALKAKGNSFFEKRDFTKAIEFYSEAISLDKTNHLLLSNRCHALISSDRYSQALQDAEYVIKLRPDWPKGYFRKGTALYGLGKYEDAVVCFLQCLALDPGVTSAKDNLAKALHYILSALPPEDPKQLAMQKEMNPSMLQKLIQENFDSAMLLPQYNLNSIFQLQNIISETIASADNFTSVESQQASSSSTNCDKTQYFEQLRNPTFENNDGASVSPSTRKRGRLPSHTLPTSPTTSSPQKFPKSEEELKVKAGLTRIIPKELLIKEDIECALCYRVYYEPVTTPCGHVFCKNCLERSLDHQSMCPLCKSSLVEYLAERRQSVTECVQSIIETYFPVDNQERKAQHDQEVTEMTKMGIENNEIPIFVCTLGFPSVPCPLHIFEPRYRFMVRQCMESGTRQFGMCSHTTNDEFSDLGCMLEVREVQFFPDGRSILDTVGGRRFRVLSRGHKDGYDTARVEFLHEAPIDPSQLDEILKLQEETYQACKKWFSKLPVLYQHKITSHFGDFPAIDPTPHLSPNGPKWAWWITAVLPLDPKVQQALLAMISFKERILAIQKVLNFLNKKQSK